MGKKAIDLSKLETRHVYEVLPLPDRPGEWLTFCGACSRAADDYRYPCQRDAQAEPESFPSQTLFSQQRTLDLANEALFGMVNAGRALVAPDGYMLSWFDGKPIMLPVIDTPEGVGA